MRGRIQNEDIKSVADLAAAGGSPSQLPNDDKVWVKARGILKTLYDAIVDGDIGGIGGAAPSDDGFFTITLRPKIAQWIMASPDSTLWQITATDTGELVATNGASGAPINPRIVRPDLTEVSFSITNSGEIQIVEPADPGSALEASLYIQSPGLIAWHVEVTNLNDIQLVSGPRKFRLNDEEGNPLFQVVSTPGGGASVYVKVYTAATLPTTPEAVANCSPFAFLDNGTSKRPIYWTGYSWKYIDVPGLKDLGIVTSSVAINWAESDVFALDVTAPLAVTFQNIAEGQQIMVKASNPGSQEITWPSDVKWPSAVAPSPSDTVDIYTFVRIKGVTYGQGSGGFA